MDEDCRITLEKNPCPKCGKNLDAASSPDKEGATPSPGDFTICFYCGTVLRFDEGFKVRLLREGELEEQDFAFREYLNFLQKSVREFKTKRPS